MLCVSCMLMWKTSHGRLWEILISGKQGRRVFKDVSLNKWLRVFSFSPRINIISCSFQAPDSSWEDLGQMCGAAGRGGCLFLPSRGRLCLQRLIEHTRRLKVEKASQKIKSFHLTFRSIPSDSNETHWIVHDLLVRNKSELRALIALRDIIIKTTWCDIQFRTGDFQSVRRNIKTFTCICEGAKTLFQLLPAYFWSFNLSYTVWTLMGCFWLFCLVEQLGAQCRRRQRGSVINSP